MSTLAAIHPWRRALCCILLIALPAAVAAASSAAPCRDCFAVLVMPDTQFYTHVARQPAGANHLDLIGRWTCANRAYAEPGTGKEMPIAMVLQLGDLVQNGDLDEDGDGTLEQWRRIGAAFDRLDACPGGPVPYLVVPGNHDYAVTNQYSRATKGYNQTFGIERWSAYQCADPAACDWDEGEWFIGGGEPIAAGSRARRSGPQGPPTEQPGRHRAAVIRTPNGQRLLFVGLEAAFDLPQPGSTDGPDDLAWLQRVIDDHPGVPTVLVHHALIGPRGDFVPNIDGVSGFGSDFGSTEDIWKAIGFPNDQVFLTVNGHWYAMRDAQGRNTPTRESGASLVTKGGLTTHALFRNYQGLRAENAKGELCPEDTGAGWNVMLVFDPEQQEIRVRSIRIEDTDDDCSHDGAPAAPADLDMDLLSPELALPYAFPEARPDGLDNCPETASPDQRDLDGDGLGDACDPTAGIRAAAGAP